MMNVGTYLFACSITSFREFVFLADHCGRSGLTTRNIPALYFRPTDLSNTSEKPQQFQIWPVHAPSAPSGSDDPEGRAWIWRSRPSKCVELSLRPVAIKNCWKNPECMHVGGQCAPSWASGIAGSELVRCRSAAPFHSLYLRGIAGRCATAHQVRDYPAINAGRAFRL